MEVVMVSRYTSPVVSSFTTQLELMLKRLGLNTIPMDIVPTGVSQSTSTSSGILKQVTTPAKPQGGVGSHLVGESQWWPVLSLIPGGPSTISLKPEPEWSPPPKRQHSSMEGQGDMSMDKDFPVPSQGESSNPKEGKTANWLTSMKSSCVDAFSRDSDPMKEARAHYFATHSWDWAHSNSEDLSNIFRELTKKLAYWVSLFSRYNGHGKDPSI